MRVGIIGSQDYDDKNKIKDFIFYIYKTYDNVEIISSGGNIGADKFVRDICVWELDVPYREFPPYHQKWTNHCVESYYKFSKPYKAKYYHIVALKLIKYVDVLVVFIPTDTVPDDHANIGHVIKKAKKQARQYFVVH